MNRHIYNYLHWFVDIAKPEMKPSIKCYFSTGVERKVKMRFRIPSKISYRLFRYAKQHPHIAARDLRNDLRGGIDTYPLCTNIYMESSREGFFNSDLTKKSASDA